MFNKKDQIKMFMFQSVFGFANRNQAITSMIIAFKLGITRMGDIINSLLELGSQPNTIVGSGQQKEQSRMALDQMSYVIVKACFGYFNKIQNADHAAKLKMSQTDIIRISDTNIVSTANGWITLINPFISKLSDWNITPQTIIDWKLAIKNYSDVLLMPNDQLEARRERNKKIKALITEGMELCNNELDSAAIGYKTNGNLDFFNQYTERRILTQKATRHGKFRIIVFDDLQQPVSHVTLTQDKNGKQAITDMGGQASLDIVYNKTKNKGIANIYSFTLTSGTKTINSGLIEIKHNQTITRTYYLEPLGFIVPAFQPLVVKVIEPA